jgi:hypothetical protein
MRRVSRVLCQRVIRKATDEDIRLRYSSQKSQSSGLPSIGTCDVVAMAGLDDIEEIHQTGIEELWAYIHLMAQI